MLVNITYFDCNEDADIINVPANIYNEIEIYGQQFCDWISSENIDDEYYVIIDGRKCINLETDGFVNWLNKYVCPDNDKASIVKQHTKLDPAYKTVDF